MQIRLLRYFVALAREEHFRRAAEQCGVTQPTLSAGIGALEAQLGRRLVMRGRRYLGLTPEGEAVLPWARQLLAAHEGIAQSLEAVGRPLSGELRLGAIPASLPVTGHVVGALLSACPGLTVRISSLTSREIEAKLDAFELDAGLTYLDHEPPTGVLAVPLYAEHYVYVAPAGWSAGAVSWEDALSHPLCLLHQGMQNRRILDARLAERGLAPCPVVLADSYVSLLAMVQTGQCATIMPDSYVTLLPDLAFARIRPFTRPIAPSRVGLILSHRDLMGPLPSAILAAARLLRLPHPYAL